MIVDNRTNSRIVGGMHGNINIEPIGRESTASIIARQLRNALRDGSFPPGTQLGEHDLAARLQVSRGVLREAMQRLVQEGLLRSEHNRGLFVTEVDTDDIYDIYLTRTIIERAALAVILDLDPDRSADRLERAHRKMVTAAERADFSALSEADLAFHQILVEEAESPRLQRMYDTLLLETRLCITKLETTYDAPHDIADEHAAIIEALRDRDRTRLARLINAHTNDALARLLPPERRRPNRRRRKAFGEL